MKKKDISITGEEIFLPTSPEEVGGGETHENVPSVPIVQEKALPTKPEDIEI